MHKNGNHRKSSGATQLFFSLVIKTTKAHVLYDPEPMSGCQKPGNEIMIVKSKRTGVKGLNGPRLRPPPQVSRKKGLVKPKA